MQSPAHMNITKPRTIQTSDLRTVTGGLSYGNYHVNGIAGGGQYSAGNGIYISPWTGHAHR